MIQLFTYSAFGRHNQNERYMYMYHNTKLDYQLFWCMRHFLQLTHQKEKVIPLCLHSEVGYQNIDLHFQLIIVNVEL